MKTKNEETTRLCKHCSQCLEKRGKEKRVRPNRKFCNQTCRTRFNARSDYEKNKDDEQYKEKNKKKSKEWYSKNRETHLKKIKESKNLSKIVVQ